MHTGEQPGLSAQHRLPGRIAVTLPLIIALLSLTPAQAAATMTRDAARDTPSSRHETLYVFTPARSGESLERIASYLIPHPDVSLQQTAWALYLKNPTAFAENNINSIKPLPTLQIPSLQEIWKISHAQAQRLIAGHNRAWARTIHDHTPTERQETDDTIVEETATGPEHQPFTINTTVEIESDYRSGYTLGHEDDETLTVSSYIYTEMRYEPSDRFTYFLELNPYYSAEGIVGNEDGSNDGGVELGSAWVYIDNLAGDDVGIQAGRQYFGDSRQWWWDANLNALRLHSWGQPIHFHLGIGTHPTLVSTTGGRRDPEQRDIVWLLGELNWDWANDQSIEFFWLSRLDRSDTPRQDDIVATKDADEEDVVLTWLGLRAMGQRTYATHGNLRYWLDLGMVYGNESRLEFEDTDRANSIVTSRLDHKIDGWGLDIGASWDTRFPTRPRLTIAYAMGSGDADTGDNTDRNYRQSGLHNNNAELYGDTTFRYYGDVLDPELSNLSIATLAIGFPLWKNNSINIVYHHYQQIHASAFLRNTQLSVDPNGDHLDIGQELGLIVGLTGQPPLNVTLRAAQFRAGKAFSAAAGQTASRLAFELSYGF